MNKLDEYYEKCGNRLGGWISCVGIFFPEIDFEIESIHNDVKPEFSIMCFDMSYVKVFNKGQYGNAVIEGVGMDRFNTNIIYESFEEAKFKGVTLQSKDFIHPEFILEL